MEAVSSKWRHLHESSKNRVQSPIPLIERFRSSSREDLQLENSQKSITRIAELLPSNLPKVKSSKQFKPIEYYQTNDKERERKTDAYLKDPTNLKKQLVRMGEDRPEDKKIIDSAITMMHNYESQIRTLQEQLQKYKKTAVNKSNVVDQILIHSQDDNESNAKSEFFGSQKTVSTLPSSKAIPVSKKRTATDYYFPIGQ